MQDTATVEDALDHRLLPLPNASGHVDALLNDNGPDTAAALGISALVWRRESAAARQRSDRGYGRAGMMGLVGLGANALFLSIIVAGGAAVLVPPVCQS